MKLKHYILICFASIALLSSSSLQTGQEPVEEYELKATFLYRFLDYIEWDKTEDETVSIAVMGDSEMYTSLLTLSQKRTARSRPIRVSKIESAAEIGANQVIFVPRDYKNRLEQITEMLTAKPTLIISEQKGDLEKGSHINFLFAENKLKFEINLKSASKSGIKIGSQLLQHAAAIKK